MATQFDYNGHTVIILKARGKESRKITILKQGTAKIIKTMPEMDMSLRRAKSLAKDYIGINRS